MLDEALRTSRVVLVAAVLRDQGSAVRATLLPVRILETDGSLDERCEVRGVEVALAATEAPAGAVVRWERSSAGIERTTARYDDVAELLSPTEPAQGLLNALWVLHEHGCQPAHRDRVLRSLGRLEGHRDPKVRSEARAASERV
jgi:hypothetical protein